MERTDKRDERASEVGKEVIATLDEMRAAVREGDVQRIAVCNDRIIKVSTKVQGTLHELAGYREP